MRRCSSIQRRPVGHRRTFDDFVSNNRGLIQANVVNDVVFEAVHELKDVSDVHIFSTSGATLFGNKTAGAMTGGMVRIVDNSDVKFTNLTFQGGRATQQGGRVFVQNSRAVFYDVNFDACRSDNQGGSVFVVTSTLMMYGGSFTDTYARRKASFHSPLPLPHHYIFAR